MNLIKKYWLYKAKKQIIEKYNQIACYRSMNLFSKDYLDYELTIFDIHRCLVQILSDIDDQDCADRSWYELRLQKLNENLDNVKEGFVRLFKRYHYCVRMYHWMYTHGHHNKYAQVFSDGQTFKNYYENSIERYEMEFKPFDISLEMKKYKINKRKKELENDFD